MRRRILKKSQVLREGYMKGLRKAQRIINEMMYNMQGFGNVTDDEIDTTGTGGGARAAKIAAKQKRDANRMLKDAIYDDNIQKMEQALKNGADPNGQYSQLENMLHAAVCNNVTQVKLLLKYGADPNIRDKYFNSTSLHYAADAGDLESCKALIEGGADPNAEDKSGNRPADLARDNRRPSSKVVYKYLRQYETE